MNETLSRIPTHAAIIVDGNRRWAKKRNLPVSFGHKAGFERLKEITRYAVGDCGVHVLSLYVFSTENFARDAREVGYLMDLFANNFRSIAQEMNERQCQVLFSGRREGLQQRVLDAMDYMMDLTRDNKKGIVNFCLNYGSHAEMTDAVRAIAGEVKAGTLAPEQITEKTIEDHFYRQLPPVDFLIRTSGEQRISNFLLWQCAYAEFYFTPALFPDFDKSCFDAALAEYARRDRRMGGNSRTAK
jgi:undecaprenyl diphosphate synthase